MKSCQMRKKSSVSPNLIGEKRSHDFAAGGSWHAERARLESTVIHPHYERTAMQNQVMGHHVPEMCSFPKLVYRSMETSAIRSAACWPSMQIRFAIVYHTHAGKEADLGGEWSNLHALPLLAPHYRAGFVLRCAWSRTSDICAISQALQKHVIFWMPKNDARILRQITLLEMRW